MKHSELKNQHCSVINFCSSFVFREKKILFITTVVTRCATLVSCRFFFALVLCELSPVCITLTACYLYWVYLIRDMTWSSISLFILRFRLYRQYSIFSVIICQLKTKDKFCLMLFVSQPQDFTVLQYTVILPVLWAFLAVRYTRIEPLTKA